jgi:lactate dehydrogenase-like 2-hydroxyacid dehydrogenase
VKLRSKFSLICSTKKKLPMVHSSVASKFVPISTGSLSEVNQLELCCTVSAGYDVRSKDQV